MFFKPVGKPTKAKKIIYLIAFIVLGLLLSFNLHALIEIAYLQLASKKDVVVTFYGGCTLPIFVQVLLPIIGIFSGLFAGLFWWKKIYVERCLDKY